MELSIDWRAPGIGLQWGGSWRPMVATAIQSSVAGKHLLPQRAERQGAIPQGKGLAVKTTPPGGEGRALGVEEIAGDQPSKAVPLYYSETSLHALVGSSSLERTRFAHTSNCVESIYGFHCTHLGFINNVVANCVASLTTSIDMSGNNINPDTISDKEL